jgi:hypothetical protein
MKMPMMQEHIKGTEKKMTVTNTKFRMIKGDEWRGNY